MTGRTVPRRLVMVRLRVVVEGVVFERLFEADVDLQYRYTWDRRNAYNQKVYGFVTATGELLTTGQWHSVGRSAAPPRNARGYLSGPQYSVRGAHFVSKTNQNAGF